MPIKKVKKLKQKVSSGNGDAEEEEEEIIKNKFFDLNPCKILVESDTASNLPIVYSENYNISAWGLESLHPFDAKKWGRVVQFLSEDGFFNTSQLIKPISLTNHDLLSVHTQEYLDSLGSSSTIAQITEVPPAALLPNSILQSRLVSPMRLQAGGSILAAHKALTGWSINIGGGFHHAFGESGGGFCMFADISLIVKSLHVFYPAKKWKILIVDLDCHQGNGFERDFLPKKNPIIPNVECISILDMYNSDIYPNDRFAKKAINYPVPVHCGCDTDLYLASLQSILDVAFEDSKPNFVIYNAGSDILSGDPLGQIDVSPEGLIQRDYLVFKACLDRKVPIVMLTSGGYQKSNARVIANSVMNLEKKLQLKKHANSLTPPISPFYPQQKASTSSGTTSVSESEISTSTTTTTTSLES